MRSHSASNHNARSDSSVACQASAPVFKARKWSRQKTKAARPLLDVRGGAADAGSRAAPSERSGGREAADALYLSSGHCCSNLPDERFIEHVLKIKPCWCRKWYCSDCAPRMGGALQAKLRERLQKFARVFGITLTIDGSLFSTPEEAWRYVMDNRLLSLFVKKLRSRGHLNSRDYFWVVEWQEETQQAHWHLLVDSRFVPFGDIVEIWSSFRPKFAPPLPEKVTATNYKNFERPAFGSVRFSFQNASPWAASGYATKYLIKVPSYGFPDWVLDYVGRVPRYGHSRGFFAAPDDNADDKPADAAPYKPTVHDSDCFCNICRGEDGSERREYRTLRERLAACKSKSTILRVEILEDRQGRRIEGRSSFYGSLNLAYATVCNEVGCSGEESGGVEVDERTLDRLRLLESRSAGGEAQRSQDHEEDW
jgi:hypothetical protein